MTLVTSISAASLLQLSFELDMTSLELTWRCEWSEEGEDAI